MKFTNPTDEALNVAFAIEVAGWRTEISGSALMYYDELGTFRGGRNDGKPWSGIPNFTKSTDLVLPQLERSPFDVTINYSNTCSMWYVHLLGRFVSSKNFDAEDESLPRAAVIALLRASGVEVEFTQ